MICEYQINIFINRNKRDGKMYNYRYITKGGKSRPDQENS